MTQQTSNDFTLRDLLRVLDKRRRILWIVTAVSILTAVSVCVFMTRRYEAKGVFELQKSSSDSLDLEDVMSSATAGASDSLSLSTDLETQVGILESDALALQIIKELNLEQNDDFQPHFDPIAPLIELIMPKGPPDTPGASLENSPRRREKALKVWQKHLKVDVDSGTRLIEVSYTNCDRKTAAAIVNHLIQALIDYTFQTKYKATSSVSDWLGTQLDDLRKQSEDLQAKVVALQQGSGIYGVGGTDLAGKPVVYSPALDRLQASSALLTQAQINRVVKESIYKIAQTGNPEAISQLAGTTLPLQSSSGVVDSLALIQTLRQQESTLAAQIGQDASQYGPADPKLIQERASMKSVQESLKKEIAMISSRAQNDYQIAVATESGTQATFDSDKKAAESLNDKTIEFMILSKESEDSQDLYQDLLKRLKEAGILEGLKSSNITNVDTALTPDKPSSPNIPVILLVGLFGGFILGAGAALLSEAVDNKVRGTEEVEALGIPLLGIVPAFASSPRRQPSAGGSGQIFLDSQEREFGESIRRLRSNLLIARSGLPPQILLITSGSPSEGKTTVSVNLAAALGQYGKKVLLIEADMRRPVLKRRLHLEMDGGLSTVLSNATATSAPETLQGHPNLAVMPSGPVPPYPSELLGSALLHSLLEKWRQEFDFIVVDSPPILPVTDAQILVEEADATVLVVRAGLTTRVGLRRSFSLIIQHVKDQAHPAVGALLNGISSGSAAYYGYYGYYGYKSYYGSKEEKNNE